MHANEPAQCDLFQIAAQQHRPAVSIVNNYHGNQLAVSLNSTMLQQFCVPNDFTLSPLYI